MKTCLTCRQEIELPKNKVRDTYEAQLLAALSARPLVGFTQEARSLRDFTLRDHPISSERSQFGA